MTFIKPAFVRLNHVLTTSIFFVVMTSILGWLLHNHALYTWGLPWTFSIPTAFIYLLLGVSFFLPGNVKIGCCLGALLLSGYAIGSSYNGYSFGTWIVQLCIAIALLFEARWIKYLTSGVALWICLLGIVRMAVPLDTTVFDPILNNFSLPSILVGIAFTPIIVERDYSLRLDRSFLRLPELIIIALVFVGWGAIAFAIKSQSIEFGYGVVASIVTGLVISLHYQRTKNDKAETYRRQLFDGINNSAIAAITDIEGVILMANDHFCEASGYTEEELVGNTHRLVNSGIHPEAFWKELWETILSGKTWSGEVCNRNKSGEIFWEHTTITPIFDRKGNVESFLAVRFDITEQVKQNETLKLYQSEQETLIQNQKRLIEFRSSVQRVIAHDLRTPIGQFITIGDMLENSSLSEPEFKETIELLKSSAENTLQDLENLLDIEKSKSSLDGEEPTFIDPRSIALNEVSSHQFRLANKQIRLSKLFEIEDQYLGRKNILTHVIRNLLSNAIKYTPNKGRIHLEITSINHHLQLTVADSGPGIPIEQRDKIFESFYLNHSENQDDKSWGLGLAYVYEAIISIGGRIEIKESRWKGAEFVVKFPILSRL